MSLSHTKNLFSLGQFDQINQIITLTVIILSGAHCKAYCRYLSFWPVVVVTIKIGQLKNNKKTFSLNKYVLDISIKKLGTDLYKE
jgi:hypothetical protein